MATPEQWARGYSRQAAADFETYETLRTQDVPECHQLQFLQMACEKLVKAHLCQQGANPRNLQSSHAYVSGTLPVVLRQHATTVGFQGKAAHQAMNHARRLSREIELLAPAVRRGGVRPDNCEYPWEDDAGVLHVPLDWSFSPSQMLLEAGGRTFLKLVQGAITSLNTE